MQSHQLPAVRKKRKEKLPLVSFWNRHCRGAFSDSLPVITAPFADFRSSQSLSSPCLKHVRKISRNLALILRYWLTAFQISLFNIWKPSYFFIFNSSTRCNVKNVHRWVDFPYAPFHMHIYFLKHWCIKGFLCSSSLMILHQMLKYIKSHFIQLNLTMSIKCRLCRFQMPYVYRNLSQTGTFTLCIAYIRCPTTFKVQVHCMRIYYWGFICKSTPTSNKT